MDSLSDKFKGSFNGGEGAGEVFQEVIHHHTRIFYQRQSIFHHCSHLNTSLHLKNVPQIHFCLKSETWTLNNTKCNFSFNLDIII